MKDRYDDLPNGYQETIQKGLNALRVFSRISYGIGTREEQLIKLKNELATANAIVIGAGAGLSTSAGLTYSGERFDLYFFDFKRRFGITDIYSGGFYPFPDEETLGVVGKAYLFQSLCRSAEAGLSRTTGACERQKLFCRHNQCRSSIPTRRI